MRMNFHAIVYRPLDICSVHRQLRKSLTTAALGELQYSMRLHSETFNCHQRTVIIIL